jgi:hypothetical protein
MHGQTDRQTDISSIRCVHLCKNEAEVLISQPILIGIIEEMGDMHTNKQTNSQAFVATSFSSDLLTNGKTLSYNCQKLASTSKFIDIGNKRKNVMI